MLNFVWLSDAGSCIIVVDICNVCSVSLCLFSGTNVLDENPHTKMQFTLKARIELNTLHIIVLINDVVLYCSIC